MFAEADRDVAHFIYRTCLEAAEVLHARQNDVNEFIEKRSRTSATEGHLVACNIAGTDFKIGDPLFCATNSGGLASDFCKAINDHLKTLLVLNGADARPEDDLNDARCLHNIFKAKGILHGLKSFFLCCACIHIALFNFLPALYGDALTHSIRAARNLDAARLARLWIDDHYIGNMQGLRYVDNLPLATLTRGTAMTLHEIDTIQEHAIFLA